MSKGNQTKIAAEPGKHAVVITRRFDAPRRLVAKALTDPAAIAQWWGPRELTTSVDKMDVKAGGLWRFRQRDAQGNEYDFYGVYHSIDLPARIVQTFEFEGAPGHVSLETTTLEELGDQTLLKTISVFQSVEDRDAMVAAGMEKGVVEGYERLDQVLASLQPA